MKKSRPLIKELSTAKNVRKNTKLEPQRYFTKTNIKSRKKVAESMHNLKYQTILVKKTRISWEKLQTYALKIGESGLKIIIFWRIWTLKSKSSRSIPEMSRVTQNNLKVTKKTRKFKLWRGHLQFKKSKNLRKGTQKTLWKTLLNCS